jgi:hypothetical protein
MYLDDILSEAVIFASKDGDLGVFRMTLVAGANGVGV